MSEVDISSLSAGSSVAPVEAVALYAEFTAMPGAGDTVAELIGDYAHVVRAESGRIDYDEKTNSLTPTLVRAKTEERDEENPEDFSKSPRAPSVDRAEQWRIPLDGYLNRSVARTKPEWLTQEALRAEQAKLAARPAPPAEKKQQYEREELQLELIAQERFNLALAVFSFATKLRPDNSLIITSIANAAGLGVASSLVRPIERLL